MIFTLITNLDFMNLPPKVNMPKDSALLGLFAVDPAHQSKGIGKFLMQKSLDYIKYEWKCSKALVWVINSRHDILAWYAKMGFEWRDEQTVDFVMPDNAMVDGIYFKVLQKDL